MIRCAACRKTLRLQGMLSLFNGAKERATALYGVASRLGWVENPRGSWSCSTCAAGAREALRVGAAS